MEDLVIRRTRRIPDPGGPPGDGAAAARQFDAALMSVGFKLSREVLERLSGLGEGTVIETAVRVMRAVQREVGEHVSHNVYFVNFPANVPDTVDFWVSCLRNTLVGREDVTMVTGRPLNLLEFPLYGRYQQSYAELLAAHDEFIPAAGDRVTLLHLGGPLDEEIQRLYLSLAGSQVPLGEDGLTDLAALAAHCTEHPVAVPLRENRAIVNAVRVEHGMEPLVDTVTDVLRLACALSGGDVMLQRPTAFGPLRRHLRRALLAALDGVVAADRRKLGDVPVHAERWKRLGERLHPHEYPKWPHAAQVFAVARGELRAESVAGRVEAALREGGAGAAVSVLSATPGLLFRSLDRLLRTAASPAEGEAVVEAVEKTAPAVSGRVLLSVREHLHNRAGRARGRRVFANRRGTAWVAEDERGPLDGGATVRVIDAIDAEVLRRLPDVDRLVVDRDVLTVALPLTGASTPDGFGILPRGSVSAVEGGLLRFFVYWRESRERTDYDLSALLLGADYGHPEWLSYTSLTTFGGEHSGDIVEAPRGASEFINIDLGLVRSAFIVPQVNIYAGEGFDQAAEAFFGFMLREAEQRGMPFEAATVRMRSDLRGRGRVALPLAFVRSADGSWYAKWLHLYLAGRAAFNQVEGNRLSTSTLMRGIVERDYLTVGYLVDLWRAKGAEVTVWGEAPPEGPVTFVGIQRPEGLPEGSEVYALDRLRDLVPG